MVGFVRESWETWCSECFLAGKCQRQLGNGGKFSTMSNSRTIEQKSEPAARLQPRVLFVDDDTSLCEMLSLYFQHFGMKVTTTGRPWHAIELLNQVSFDAVVLDLNLAGEDGLEVLRFAKGRFPFLPVIVFTGLDVDETLVKRCLANRADGFMRKTAGLGTLLAEVRRHVPESITT